MDMDWDSISKIIAATAALGTSSFGVVDATKAFSGGISNVGYGFIKDALKPFEAALSLIDDQKPYAVAQANWINGLDKGEQKNAAKNLIRLGLTGDTAESLASALPNIDGTKLTKVAKKIDLGEALVDDEVTLLGRFDAIVDARLDAAFERADQKYRNTARVAAALVAVALSEAGAYLITPVFDAGAFSQALMVGLVATPIAPLAKDLTSALSTALAAYKSVKR